MEHIVNSVKQIEDEINKLLEIADDINYQDVQMSASIVRSSLKELLDAFNSEEINESVVNNAKIFTEIDAINLEYFIQAHSNNYKERYQLRKFSENLLTDTHEIFMIVSNLKEEKDDKEIIAWATYCSFALRLHTASKHIIFELSEEDQNMIKHITQEMNLFRENNPTFFRR